MARGPWPDKKGMDATRGLIPHPARGPFRSVAGSYSPVEKPVAIPPYSHRPDVSPKAFSTMLALLEILRNLVISGHEPAAYIIATLEGGQARIVVAGEQERLGSVRPGFRVGSRAVSGGNWLEVSDATEPQGYRLEQFCRRLPDGRLEALPHVWRRAERPLPSWTPGQGLGCRVAAAIYSAQTFSNT